MVAFGHQISNIPGLSSHMDTSAGLIMRLLVIVSQQVLECILLATTNYYVFCGSGSPQIVLLPSKQVENRWTAMKKHVVGSEDEG